MLAAGNRPLCGWDEVEAYCREMKIVNGMGYPLKRDQMIRRGMPYTRQGKYRQVWTTTYLLIAWWVANPLPPIKGIPSGLFGRASSDLNPAHYRRAAARQAERRRAAEQASPAVLVPIVSLPMMKEPESGPEAPAAE